MYLYIEVLAKNHNLILSQQVTKLYRVKCNLQIMICKKQLTYVPCDILHLTPASSA